LSADAIRQGLSRVDWPGRLQTLTFEDGRELLLDAAHNPAGALALTIHIQRLGDKRPLVFGAMRDKDAEAMLTVLAPHVSALLLTRASNQRAAEPEDLLRLARRLLPSLPVSVHASPAEALDAAWQLNRQILVAGSIFLIGDVMKALGRSW